MIVVDGDYYISKYNQEFNNLWAQFSKQELERKEHAAAKTIQQGFRKKQATKKANQKKSSDPWGLE